MKGIPWGFLKSARFHTERFAWTSLMYLALRRLERLNGTRQLPR